MPRNQFYYHERKVRGRVNLVAPEPFKPMGFKPVKGGRWKIRKKLWATKPWRAWTEGKASRWNRSFATHAEAIAWAQFIAASYHICQNAEEANSLIRTIRAIRKQRNDGL